jgi:SAM-dependent methyltransferase
MSAFTHMLQPDLEHYLREFHRILVPGGQVLATVFIYDSQVPDHAKQTNLTQYGLFFDHEYADGCRINNLEYPTRAVTYTLEKLEAMISACGLALARAPLRGHWSGDPRYLADAVDGQDILVPQKPW